MQASHIDTLKFSKKLISSGFSEVQAEMLSESLFEVTEIYTDDMTKKDEFVLLKNDITTLKEDVGVLKQDVSALKGDLAVLKHDVGILKVDMIFVKEKINHLDGKIDSKTDNIEKRMDNRFTALELTIDKQKNEIIWQLGSLILLLFSLFSALDIYLKA